MLAFSAREFAPQRVRRMVGVLTAVLCGLVPPEYIDRCFTEDDLATPVAPPEGMWLDRIQLAPKAEKAWVREPGLRIDALACHTAQRHIERQVCAAALPKLRDFREGLQAELHEYLVG